MPLFLWIWRRHSPHPHPTCTYVPVFAWRPGWLPALLARAAPGTACARSACWGAAAGGWSRWCAASASSSSGPCCSPWRHRLSCLHNSSNHAPWAIIYPPNCNMQWFYLTLNQVTAHKNGAYTASSTLHVGVTYSEIRSAQRRPQHNCRRYYVIKLLAWAEWLLSDYAGCCRSYVLSCCCWGRRVCMVSDMRWLWCVVWYAVVMW